MHPRGCAPVLEVDQLATVMGMVRAGLGISVVPALTLFHFRDPALVIRALGWPGLRRRIYLVRRRDRGLSVAADSLYRLLLRHKPQVDAVSRWIASGRAMRCRTAGTDSTWRSARPRRVRASTPAG